MGAKIGHIVSKETRLKISNTQMGRKLSDETKTKMSLTALGKKKVSSLEILNNYKEGAKKRKNYRGGVTSQNRLERDKFTKFIIPKILQRDKYTCTICNQTGSDLHVDHIKSWKDYPESRLDFNNCRTVCRGCHYFITFNKVMPQGSKWGLYWYLKKLKK